MSDDKRNSQAQECDRETMGFWQTAFMFLFAGIFLGICLEDHVMNNTTDVKW